VRKADKKSASAEVIAADPRPARLDRPGAEHRQQGRHQEPEPEPEPDPPRHGAVRKGKSSQRARLQRLRLRLRTSFTGDRASLRRMHRGEARLALQSGRQDNAVTANWRSPRRTLLPHLYTTLDSQKLGAKIESVHQAVANYRELAAYIHPSWRSGCQCRHHRNTIQYLLCSNFPPTDDDTISYRAQAIEVWCGVVWCSPAASTSTLATSYLQRERESSSWPRPSRNT